MHATPTGAASTPCLRLPRACGAANNVTKFLTSMGPQTSGVKGRLMVDHTDEAVRGTLITERGQLLWPPPRVEPPKPQAAAQAAAAAQPAAAEVVEPIDPRKEYLRTAMFASAGSASILALGLAHPPPVFNAMLSTFALSTMCV
jgi:hypothetical protein